METNKFNKNYDASAQKIQVHMEKKLKKTYLEIHPHIGRSNIINM